jgi:hypothetical protein
MGVAADAAGEVLEVMPAVYQSIALEKGLVCAKPNYFHRKGA